MDATDLLTVSEVAQILGVDPQTVRRWGDDGDLSMTRLPGGSKARRFLRSEVEEMATRMRTELEAKS